MNTTKYRFAALAVMFLPLSSYGLGFRIADQDAGATARGNAFAATADNPSAIYYNPAGITQLDGIHVLEGAYAITLQTDVSLDLPGGNTHFSTINDDLQMVPTFYLTWKQKDRPLALGLGVYAPYGFAIEYDDKTPIRTLARKGSIQCLTLNPVIAWKITDQLSIAAGPTISYGKALLERGVLAVGDTFKFKGDGFSCGFNAGILWDPHPQHHFGLTYRSTSRMTVSGHSSVETDPFTAQTPFGPVPVAGINRHDDADATIDFPQNIVVGYSFRPAPDWNIEFNLDWTDWDNLNTVTLHQTSGDALIPFNWRSSFMYEFGVTKKFARGINVSAGYMYSENSVPNESFNPQIPDSDRHVFSAGFGQSSERFQWQLAYQFAYGPSRHIENGSLADGDYTFKSHAVTISLGYRF